MAKRKPKMPETVKIGYARYLVEPVPGDYADENQFNGQIQYKERKIEIDRTLTHDQLVTTLLHEILHGIIEVFDVKFENIEAEERVVNPIANGLTTVFADNPEILNFVVNSLHGESGRTGNGVGKGQQNRSRSARKRRV